MAINPVRQVLGLLTYSNAVEIPLKNMGDLSGVADWQKDRDYAVVSLRPLAQQETITYLSKPDRLLYSTEYRTPAAPIFSMTCARFAP